MTFATFFLAGSKMFFVTSQIKHKRHFEGITAHTKAPFLFCICLHKKRSYPSRIPAFFAKKAYQVTGVSSNL